MTAAPGRRPLLGIATIGQTPRPDLMAAFSTAAPQADVQVAGALDGLTAAAIAALAVPGAYPLLVRLANGATAEIPRDSLVPLVARAAASLADAGAALVVVACAGEFPAIPCSVPVLLPGRVVPATVRAVAAGARVGVVTPNAAQVPFAEAKWRDDGFDAVVTSASPARHDEIAAAAAVMRGGDVAIVVLDCMGHDEAYRIEFARLSGRPTLAAQALVAGLAGALL
jgi:protein AroM